MPQIPKSDKKCAKCGAPAEVTMTDVKGGKGTGERPLCNCCAMEEGFWFTNTPARRFALFVQTLQQAAKAGEDTSPILAQMKKLTGQDLPADPSAWWKWLREHPEDVRLDDDEFYEALSKLQIRFFDSTPRGRVELLLAMLETATERGGDVSQALARIKAATGKELPAEPEAWRQWMNEHPEEVVINNEQFLLTLSELGVMNPPDPYEGLKRRINPEKPFSNT